ncbi:MAG TPA: DNA glycosylase [Chthonomonadaceae bacterium]|nr:DNA glycosylase [Chthonomonadaceae bacterium]
MPPPASFRWNRSECAETPLNLSATLASGQSFRWRRDESGVWWGVVGQSVVAAWQAEGEPESPLYWQTFPEADRWDILADYFRLNVDLDTLYTEWSQAEPRIAEAVDTFRGLRILRQPPLECFFAFQCAACNTVVKIERSVYRLAARYGQRLLAGETPPQPSPSQGEGASRRSPSPSPGERVPSGSPPPYEGESHRLAPPPYEGESHRLAPPPYEGGGRGEVKPFYAFPTLAALATADEAALRADLWGYRAPRVIALARHLQTLPPGWLESLRDVPYAEAKAALTGLFGVGAKLADCICLFALDKDEAVPVDTHVRQIACRLFAPELAGKSLTPRIYDALADAYRARFGPYAGWAQQVLFFGELRRAQAYKV